MTEQDRPRDRLYATHQQAVQRFCFDEHVAQVFPDMIGRSVPGYGLLVDMIGVLAAEHAQTDSVCYDLGCSLGAVAFAMCASVPHQNCRIVGVDTSEAMLARANAALQQMPAGIPVVFRCEDVTAMRFEPASVIVMNFTLQFIAPDQRDALLQRLYQALLPGGILVLSEKLRFDALSEQEELMRLHHAFKRAQGYSDLEVAQKRQALENVLLPDSSDEHLQRLRAAGFDQAVRWFQCFNFASFVAIR